MIHPADPWPAPEKQAPQVPTLREFTNQFLAYVEVQKKAGTKRFYEICSNRVLRFGPRCLFFVISSFLPIKVAQLD